MRKNEFNTLMDFTSQYVGEWNPSVEHWFGLDFSYHNSEYRFCTGSMYNKEDTMLVDGRYALFYLYKKHPTTNQYELLGEFADMVDVLKSTVIEGIFFKNVIMDDETEILGQD